MSPPHLGSLVDWHHVRPCLDIPRGQIRHQGHRTNSMLVAEETVSRRGRKRTRSRGITQSNQNLNNYTANKPVVVLHFIFNESLSWTLKLHKGRHQQQFRPSSTTATHNGRCISSPDTVDAPLLLLLALFICQTGLPSLHLNFCSTQEKKNRGRHRNTTGVDDMVVGSEIEREKDSIILEGTTTNYPYKLITDWLLCWI